MQKAGFLTTRHIWACCDIVSTCDMRFFPNIIFSTVDSQSFNNSFSDFNVKHIFPGCNNSVNEFMKICGLKEIYPAGNLC